MKAGMPGPGLYRQRTMQFVPLALAAILGSPTLALSQHATPPQGLWALYVEARSLAPIMASAHSQFVADQQAVPEARAAFLPKIAINVEDAHDAADLSEGRTSVYPSKGTTISLKQSLFNAPDWETYQQAKLVAEQGEVRFSAAEQMLMLQVCEDYFALLGAQEDLRFAKSHTSMIEQQLALAQHRYQQGDVTVIDEQEAEADLERAHSSELAAANAIDEQRAELMRRIGRDVDEVSPLPDDVPLGRFVETDEQYWASQAIDHSLDVQQRQLARFIADRELAKNRAAFLPTVSVTLSHSNGNLEYLNDQVAISTDGNQNTFHQGNANVAMLQISIPLFDGFSTVSKERETDALRDKAQSDLEDARLTAEFQAKQLYLHLANDFAQQQTLSRALASSSLALDSNKVGYEVGVRINTDVLRAQDVVYAAERDLARSRYDIVLDHLRLRANAGQLGEQDLQAVNAILTDK
jgi:outer membrane protein